jgi:hypothetical protein
LPSISRRQSRIVLPHDDSLDDDDMLTMVIIMVMSRRIVPPHDDSLDDDFVVW